MYEIPVGTADLAILQEYLCLSFFPLTLSFITTSAEELKLGFYLELSGYTYLRQLISIVGHADECC